MADGIVREFENGFKAGLCIEHLPNRKKPVLVATMGITRFKVAEITDERGLREVCKLLFSEAKGVELMATISIDPNIRYEDGRILYDFSITETAIQELNAKVEDELFERLAEKRGYVKERTCTMKYEFEDSKYYDGFDLYPVSGVECSKCKEIIYDCNTLNYCPNCGARVEEVE